LLERKAETPQSGSLVMRKIVLQYYTNNKRLIGAFGGRSFRDQLAMSLIIHWMGSTERVKLPDLPCCEELAEDLVKVSCRSKVTLPTSLRSLATSGVPICHQPSESYRNDRYGCSSQGIRAHRPPKPHSS
jgi:hypothetical protein